MKSRTEILVPIAAIQAVPIAVIAWYRLHRYAWYRYSAIVIINRDDIQELVGEYKRRIGKLIFDSYQALVEAVKIWNNEEKRQEVCRYIQETAGQYPNHRGMKKKLMDLMPETPFEGEPMAVTREPNDMEKSLL